MTQQEIKQKRMEIDNKHHALLKSIASQMKIIDQERELLQSNCKHPYTSWVDYYIIECDDCGYRFT